MKIGAGGTIGEQLKGIEKAVHLTRANEFVENRVLRRISHHGICFPLSGAAQVGPH